MSESKKLVWITGASSGIGEALALQYAKRKQPLVLSARDRNKLEELAGRCRKEGISVSVVALDLSQPDSVKAAYEEIRNSGLKPDILINNAGISQRAKAYEATQEVERRIFEINFFGTVELTRLLMKDMMARKSGHICVVSSIAGKFGFPLRSAYSASKHALQGYFESLSAELKAFGIKVTIVSPGRVKTNISFNALGPEGKAHARMDKGQEEGISSELCAKKIIRAIDKNKRDVLIGGKELLMVHIHRYIRPLYYKLLNKIKAT